MAARVAPRLLGWVTAARVPPGSPRSVVAGRTSAGRAKVARPDPTGAAWRAGAWGQRGTASRGQVPAPGPPLLPGTPSWARHPGAKVAAAPGPGDRTGTSWVWSPSDDRHAQVGLGMPSWVHYRRRAAATGWAELAHLWRRATTLCWSQQAAAATPRGAHPRLWPVPLVVAVTAKPVAAAMPWGTGPHLWQVPPVTVPVAATQERAASGWAGPRAGIPSEAQWLGLVAAILPATPRRPNLVVGVEPVAGARRRTGQVVTFHDQSGGLRDATGSGMPAAATHNRRVTLLPKISETRPKQALSWSERGSAAPGEPGCHRLRPRW